MMMQSLPGLINNAARHIEQDGDTRGFAFDLRHLLKNLKELHQRKAEGQKVLDEFFAVYVMD